LCVKGANRTTFKNKEKGSPRGEKGPFGGVGNRGGQRFKEKKKGVRTEVGGFRGGGGNRKKALDKEGRSLARIDTEKKEKMMGNFNSRKEKKTTLLLQEIREERLWEKV